MKLYFRYISLHIKSQMQYRASFIMTVITQFIQPFALLFGIYLLLERFGSIGGWTVFEIFLCYAVTGASFAISVCFARGFDMFADMVRSASFDRLLVRPRGTVLQVLCSNFALQRVGGLAQAVIVMCIAIPRAGIEWNAARVLMLPCMIIGGTMIFSGVMILQATAAFWTTEALEVANIFTDGVREHGSYPLSVYPKWITGFFTYVIPFGTVNYIPLRYLFGKTGGPAWLYVAVPLLGALFIVPCLAIWRFGVRHYSSAGS